MLACAIAQAAAFPFTSHVPERTVSCAGAEYRYLLLAPEGPQGMPALLLLHGAGDTPEPMVESWRNLALTEHIVLIAPALPRVLAFEALAPAVFTCMVEDAKRFFSLDIRRLYLFGNSMGGYLTYDAALLRSKYFAAAAVHAMNIDPDYVGIVDQAERKIPIAIYIGVRDPLVPVQGVRKTRDLLVQHGFPVHYLEIEGHDHNYYAVRDQVNADAWNFLKQKHLP